MEWIVIAALAFLMIVAWVLNFLREASARRRSASSRSALPPQDTEFTSVFDVHVSTAPRLGSVPQTMPASATAVADPQPDLGTDAHYRALAADPTTPAEHLMSLAYHVPELQEALLDHPNMYRGLLDWIATEGTPRARAALAHRRGSASPTAVAA